MDEIRVVIVDDQPLVRSGLKATFDHVADIIVVGEASNGVDALHTASRTKPHVVLMDVNMPRMGGLAATRRLCSGEAGLDVKVVILTMFDQDEHIFEALRAGASGFILKDSPTDQLIEAVRMATSGDALLSPSVTRRLIEEFARQPALRSTTSPELTQLTDRERDVFKLLVRGYRNDEIAELLMLGESTVKSHVQHLYQKLGVRDRTQVVIYAYEHGLMRPGADQDGVELHGRTRAPR